MQHLAIDTVEALGTNPAPMLERLREERLAFICGRGGNDRVRPVIARAWLRSQIRRVNPDVHRVQAFKVPSAPPEFLQAAESAIRLVGQLVHGVRAVGIVTDACGSTVKVIGDPDILRQLDRVNVLPEAMLAEEVVGANAVGTALEERMGVQMWAAEHYIEGFQPFTCTAVPIFHPITRRILGVLDVTTLAEEFNETAAAHIARWVQRAALEVEWELYQRALPAQQALLFHFASEARKRGRRYLLASDGEIIFGTREGWQLLSGDDVRRLMDYVREAKASGCSFATELLLASGVPVSVTLVPKAEAGGVVGVLIFIRVLDTGPDGPADLPAPLRELAGSNPQLREGLRLAVEALSRRQSVCIVGEPGTGKYTLACALARLAGGRTETVECALVDAEWLRGAGRQIVETGRVVVFRHLEQLAPELQRELGRLVAAAGRGERLFLATVTTHAATDFQILPELAGLVAEVVVRVPALRERRSDIPQIADRILKRHLGNSRVRLSADALQVLVGASWPGNIRQLEEVLLTTLMHTPGWAITSRDLRVEAPGRPSHRRGPLTRLEEAELAEIRRALEQTRGNISRAAEVLGIGRSTLYRKLKAYGRLGYKLDFEGRE